MVRYNLLGFTIFCYCLVMSVSELCGGGGGGSGSGSGRAFERGGFRSYVSLRNLVKACSFKYCLPRSLICRFPCVGPLSFRS